MTQMSENRSVKEDESWTFSKRISIETIVLLLIQTVVLTIYITRMDGRIERGEDTTQLILKIVETLPDTKNRVSLLEARQVDALTVIDRISKIEAQMNNMQSLLQVQSGLINRIDDKLGAQQSYPKQK